MSISKKLYNYFYDLFLSEETKEKSEHVIVWIAIGSFLLHLLFILLNDLEVISIQDNNDLLQNPISAIYTPFSFILIYEVYLLIYYLPKSITEYIARQYEIITLIVIRRLFKDLSKLQLSTDWFQIQNDLQLTYDIAGTLILFVLIYIFYRLNDQRKKLYENKEELPEKMILFIRRKNILAILLIPILFGLAIYSLWDWLQVHILSIPEMVEYVKDVNKIFYDEFFTVLILTDVLLLLFSFFHTNSFHRVIRNSGFIISTILIRISFGASGLLNTILIVTAVSFGVAILAIHNQYEKLDDHVDDLPA
ncbi:MAG TPA: hypothetical protein VJ917_11590 [Saprospiraceae bacterium]|nr:hypothetical protein [Saprospiraceae bacterium]